MFVTVFSDAGVCPTTHKASWGGWAKSLRGTARGGGVLKGKITCTAVAEARAALNAIVQGIKGGIIARGDTVLIQTDNNAVPSVLDGTVTLETHKKARQATHAECKRLAEKYQITLRYKHVKGHRGRRNRRSSVNTYCDEVASFYLFQAREAVAPGKFRQKVKRVPYGLPEWVPDGDNRTEKALQRVATD